MPIELQSRQPLVLSRAGVDRYEIKWFQVENTPGGPIVRVAVSAYQVSAIETTPSDGGEVIRTQTSVEVAQLETQVYQRDRLSAVMADAFAKATAAAVTGLLPAQALYVGIRDALYAALQADGVIPTEP